MHFSKNNFHNGNAELKIKRYEIQQKMIFKRVVDVATQRRKCVIHLMKDQLSVVDDLMQTC